MAVANGGECSKREWKLNRVYGSFKLQKMRTHIYRVREVIFLWKEKGF